MIINFIRTRPLLYAAVLLGMGIAAVSPFYPLPAKNDASLFAAKDEEVFLGGVVISEVDVKENSFHQKRASFTLAAKKLWQSSKDAKNIHGKVRVYLKDITPLPVYGDEVVMKGELGLPSPRRNPGGFDFRKYLAGQGMRSIFYGNAKTDIKILRHHRANWIQEKAILLKQFLSVSLAQAFSPRDAAFLKALFLGEKSGLDEDFKDLFMKTGSIHILAVSGFNIGFLWAVIFFLLKPFPISINLKHCIVLVVIWLHCLVVGWQAPVVRASIMASIYILGKLLGRRTDLLNTLGLAACVILLFHPSQLWDVGFQLSFIAVFGIACFVPFFTKKPDLLPQERWTIGEKMRFYLSELFWVSFVCLFVTLPITVQNFYIVSPLSLLANMVVVPVSFLLYFTGILFFLTFWWLPSFLSVIPWAIKLLMSFFVASLTFIENIPGSYIIIGKLPIFLWAILTTGIFFILFYPKFKKPFKKVVVLSVFVLSIFGVQEMLHRIPASFQVTVLDVGQGDAIFVEFPDRKNLLLDAGSGGDHDMGRWVIAPFLKSKGISTIDAFVISHPQEDHIGGALTVFDEFHVKTAIEAGSEYPSKLAHALNRRIEKEGSEKILARRGVEIKSFLPAHLAILHPPPDNHSKNINNDSVVFKIIYGNTSFLFTGDIEESAINELLQNPKIKNSTVLKVPHHGAKPKEGGTAFFNLVHPQISIISVGENNSYGHPSGEAINALEKIPGNQIYRTDRDGALILQSDGETILAKKTL